MKAVLLRFIVSVYVYLAISYPLAFASSEPLTHIATLKKDQGHAPTIVFSPDETLMAGGSNNVTGATIDVWSMNDLQPVHSIKGLSRDIAFSPDGSVFVTCLKNAVQLWDVGTWRVIGILAERMAGITSVTFSHDGQILAAGDWDGTIRLWDISTQRNILTVNGHQHPDFDDAYRRVSSLDFSPDDQILASASWDNTVRLWNVDTGDEIATLNHVGSVYTAAFSPDGTILISGASGGPQQRETLKIWDARTGSNIATFDGETVTSVDFSSNGNFLVVAEGQAVSVLDAATWTRLATYQVDSPWFVKFSPDDDILVSSSWHGDILIWAAWDTATSDLFPTIAVSDETTEVVIPDFNLRNVIATAIGGFVNSPITVTKMKEISHIVGNNSQIRDLTGLESATNLTHLELRSNLISDLSPLSSLTNLTTLSLSKNSIADMSALRHLTGLTHLSLDENHIFDTSPLSSLTNLTALDLGYNFIDDISALRHLARLTSLSLNENLISDISALSELTQLTRLELYSNAIDNEDLSMLSRFTKLTYLNVAYNPVSDISPVANLTQLRHLFLFLTSVSDITPLSNLDNLVWLSLSGNGISDISAVAGLTQLSTLHLNSNNISDISALSGLVNLRDVNLKRNNVEDLSPLVSNTGIGAGDKVNVRNNPLNRSSLLVHIPRLIERRVEVQFDDVEPPITADANGDGEINILDLVLVAEHLGEEGARGVADINNDGEVNVLDLVLIADAIVPPP